MAPVAAPVRHDNFVPGRIAFAAAPTPLATDALNRLVARYGDCPLAHATVVVALGGDGFMLETIHRVLERHIPVYGMNCGSVGFLMNTFSEDDLPERLTAAQAAELHPLRMRAVTAPARWRRRWRSTRSACCGSCARAPRSASRWMGGCGWPSCPATGC